MYKRQYYALLKECHKLPTTSQPSPELFERFYQDAAAAGDLSLIHIFGMLGSPAAEYRFEAVWHGRAVRTVVREPVQSLSLIHISPARCGLRRSPFCAPC